VAIREAQNWAWESLNPRDVTKLLFGFERRWWICGGWALDLFLDRELRRHVDLDVAILRRDQLALHDHFRDWNLHYATAEHTLERWDGRPLEPPVHGIWARRSEDLTGPWMCEFLLNEARAADWVYRRDEGVTCPLGEIGAERDGIPFFKPEIVLLYKSGEPSPKSDTDFAALRPHLSEAGRVWLRRALETCEPQHPWLTSL
jgi:hypothetical protein